MRGFTLVEIAIAVVAIGLLIGTILVARDMIVTMQARSQITDWQRVSSAVVTFEGKYGCLPGDCREATRRFSTSANGNGNGFVQTDNSTSQIGGEPMLFFNHLFQARLIDVTGRNASGLPWGVWSWSDRASDVGQIIPEMKTQKQRPWFVMEPTPTNSANICFNGGRGSTGPYVLPGKHYFVTGAVLGAYNEIREHLYLPPYSGVAANGHGAMSTAQAFYIDTKIDDGRPQTGNMVSTRSRSHPCFHQQIDVPSGSFCINSSLRYNLSYNATASCSPIVSAGF